MAVLVSSQIPKSSQDCFFNLFRLSLFIRGEKINYNDICPYVSSKTSSLLLGYLRICMYNKNDLNIRMQD